MPAARVVAGQDPFEIAEIFRHARPPKIGGAGERLLALILVVETAGDRVVGVVRLVDEVGHRQLQLMRPQPAGFGRGRQAVLPAQVQQDVSGLPDQQCPRFQKGGSKGRTGDLFAIKQAYHLGFAARLSGDIDIVGAGLFQRQPDKFSASLDRRPVVEFVPHPAAPDPSWNYIDCIGLRKQPVRGEHRHRQHRSDLRCGDCRPDPGLLAFGLWLHSHADRACAHPPYGRLYYRFLGNGLSSRGTNAPHSAVAARRLQIA